MVDIPLRGVPQVPADHQKHRESTLYSPLPLHWKFQGNPSRNKKVMDQNVLGGGSILPPTLFSAITFLFLDGLPWNFQWRGRGEYNVDSRCFWWSVGPWGTPLRGISTIGRPKPAKTQPKMKPLNLLEGYILRGYKNLTPNDVNRRNERFRGIAFQNIQKNSNRSSINIFLSRRKLIEKSKKSESDLRRMTVYRRFKGRLRKGDTVFARFWVFWRHLRLT